MSYKEIIDNVSNIEDLDNVTILKVLEKFSKTIKDFAIEQSGLNNLINVEFIPSDNNATYNGTAVDYFGTLKLTLSDNIIVNKSCNIKFNIKGSNTIVVDVDEFNNSLELHLDISVVTTLDFAESERQKSKNLWAYGDVSGTQSVYIPFSLKAGTYTISANVVSSDTDSNTCLISFEKLNSTIITKFTLTRGNRSSRTFTLTEDCEQIGYYASYQWNTGANDTFSFTDIQIEQGSVATDYQPYNGEIVHEKEIADVEHIETIYDMSSSDSNINKGFTSGLMFSTTPSYSIMSQSQKNKYKYFRVTAHLVNTNLIFEFMNNIDSYARGGFACQASWLDDTSFCFGHISIADWGTINGTNCRIQNGSTVTDMRDNSNYYISKIEGVF